MRTLKNKLIYDDLELIYITSVLVILSVWIISPVLGIFPLLIFLAYIKHPKALKHLFIFLIATSLGLINYTKIPVSDLNTYYIWFNSFNQISISDFTDVQQFDYIFYFITSLLSHIVDGYAPVFILFWTIVTYYVLYLAILELSAELKLNNKIVIAIILFITFIGYGFPMTSHLVRQYTAESFLILAIVMAIKEKKSSYIFFFVSILMHMSFIIFSPLLFILNKNKFQKKKTVKYLFILLFLAFIIGIQNIFLYFDFEYTGSDLLNLLIYKAKLYATKNDGDVTFRMIYGFVIISSLVFLKTMFNHQYSDKDIKILIIIAYYVSILIVFRNTDLLLLRFFFMFYGFYLIALMYLFKTKNSYLYLGLLILAFSSPIRFFLKMPYGHEHYIENSFFIIYYTLFDFLEFNSVGI